MEKFIERMCSDLQLRGRSPHTIRSYRRCVSDLCRYYNCSPSRLSGEKIRGYLLHLLNDRKLSSSSVNVQVSALTFFYVVTMRRRSLQNFLVRPKMAYRIPVVLSEDEVSRLIVTARTPRMRALVMLLYGAGLRVSEVTRLRACDIDASRGVLRIIESKGKKSRETLLCASLLRALRVYWKTRPVSESPYVILGARGQPLTSRMIGKLISTLGQDAGVSKRVTPHLLRHCFATHLLEHGTDIRTLQSLLGHAKIETTARYVHISCSRFAGMRSPLDNLALGRSK
jgi:integrase/recombinase XerD